MKFFLILFLLVAAPAAYACSCFQIDNKAEVDMTDAVFTGKVVEITEDKSYVAPENKDKPALRNAGTDEFPIWVKNVFSVKRFLVKFKVDKRFKGVDGDEITLVQYIRELSVCAQFAFAEGKKYLVYATRIDSELINGGCARTQIFDKKSTDYKELLKMRIKS